MEASLITLALNVVLGLAVLIGFLFGLRGVKRALYSLLLFVINIVIVFIITPIVSSLVLGINISGKTINDHIFSFLNDSLGESVTSNPTAQEIIKAAPYLIVNIAVCIILIFLVGSIVKIIGAIVRKIATSQKKETVQEQKGKLVDGKIEIVTEKPKQKKHRLLGGLVGATHGFLLVASILLPLLGLVNIFNDITGANSVSAQSESGGTKIQTFSELASDFIPSEVFDYTNAVGNSILAKIGSVGNVSEVALNFVSKTDINGQTIRLGSEIRSIASAYDNLVDFLVSSSSELSEYTFETVLDDLLKNPNNYDFKKLDSAVDKLFDCKLVVALGNDVMQMVVDSVYDNTTDENSLKLVSHIKTAVQNYNDAGYKLKDDVLAMVDVFETGAKSGLIEQMRATEINIENLKNILIKSDNTASETFVDITEEVTSSNLLQKLILELTNYGLEEFEEIINQKFDVTSPVLLTKIDSKQDYKISATDLRFIVEYGVNVYDAQEGLDYENLSDDFYVVFDVDVPKIVEYAGKEINAISSLQMLKTSGVWQGICNAMGKTKYSKYINFEALKNGDDIEQQFMNLADCASEIIASGIISSLREMDESNTEAQLNAIVDKLIVKEEGNTRAYRIISPILNCEVFENAMAYALDCGHDKLEIAFLNLDENATISDFDSSHLMTEVENERLLSVVDNLLLYLKDVDFTEVNSETYMDIVLNSDLSLLGNALDSIKKSNIFNSNSSGSSYDDILDVLASTDFAKAIDFDVAKTGNFSWNGELTKISDMIEDLNSIKIDDQNVIIYLINGGDYDNALDVIKNENVVQSLKPIFEVSIINPVGVMVVNTINDTVKDFVGDDLGDFIVNIDKNTVLATQSTSIINVVESALNIDFDGDIENYDFATLDNLLDSLNTNAQASGVFTQSYNAILLKLTNLVNENVKTLVGNDTIGSDIATFTTAKNVLSYQSNIRNVVKNVIELSSDLNGKDLDNINTDDLFKFIDIFRDNSMVANGIFAGTYNALLLKTSNLINENVKLIVGSEAGSEIRLFNTPTVITNDYASIKEIVSTALDFSSSFASIEVKALDVDSLFNLINVFKDNTSTAAGIFAETYNALLVYCINTVNGTIYDSISQGYSNLDGSNDMAGIRTGSDISSNIKDILTASKEAYASLAEGEGLEDLDADRLSVLYDALDSTPYTQATKIALENYIQNHI